MLRIDIQVQRGDFALAATLDLPTPGVTALFGPSGAGKTSLAHALTGLVPAEGLIELDGTVLLDTARGIDVPCEERRVGCAFQDARLFPHLTVKDNLRYGLRRRPVAAVARWDDVLSLLGLGTLLDRRPHTLSGGERQRVALGRALLAQPRLLVLDEPLASLDPHRRDDVLPYLERLRDHYRLPMVYVSHQYDEVLRLATEIVLIDAGRILAKGSPADLSFSEVWQRHSGLSRIGAVVESVVVAVAADQRLTIVEVGGHALRLATTDTPVGGRLRLHVPADDVILATEAPRGLSVRNALPATVLGVESEPGGLVLITVGVGTDRLLSRITSSAASDLGLTPGQPVWALIKAAALAHGIYPPDSRRF